MGTAAPARAATARATRWPMRTASRALNSPAALAVRVIAESILDRPKTTRAQSRLTTAAGASRIDSFVLGPIGSPPRRPPSEYPWLAFPLTCQSFWCRYSLTDAATNVSGKVIANYWLSHVYAPEIGHAHRNADIHSHDLDMLAGYCAGWSLRQLLHEGLNGVPGKVEAGPPKHMSSAVGQIVNFLGTLQNEWAGPQAFSSFDTYMAPYIRKDRMRYGDVKQCIQELIYNLNVPSRWGTQTPFTNLTFEWVCPEDLRGQIHIIGGEEMYFCYGDMQPEMDAINRASIETITAGCFSTALAPSGA